METALIWFLCEKVFPDGDEPRLVDEDIIKRVQVRSESEGV